MHSVSGPSSPGHADCPDAPADEPEIPTVDLSAADLDWWSEECSNRLAAEAWWGWFDAKGGGR